MTLRMDSAIVDAILDSMRRNHRALDFEQPTRENLVALVEAINTTGLQSWMKDVTDLECQISDLENAAKGVIHEWRERGMATDSVGTLERVVDKAAEARRSRG